LKGYRQLGQGLYLRTGVRAELKRLGALLLDCDGVLVDARESYDRAIFEAVTTICRLLGGAPLPEGCADRALLTHFRATGGFNNDWDTTYLMALHFLTYLDRAGLQHLEEVRHRVAAFVEERTREWLALLKEALEATPPPPTRWPCETMLGSLRQLLDSPEFRDRESGERLILEAARSRGVAEEGLEAIRGLLAYPAPVGVSLVATIFDEIYYGWDLLDPMHGLQPLFIRQEGLIRRETPLTDEATLRRLRGRFGHRLGLVTGRSRLATQLTLGTLAHYFNLEASLFMEDEEKKALRRGLGFTGKPDPRWLALALERLEYRGLAGYVGDSMEDLAMVAAARRQGGEWLFLGVYGTAYEPERQLELFTEAGADVVAPTLGDLAALLGGDNG
jgi:phosphoglycolate phosphatase-like HAD superfamily hydrolase